MFDNLADTPVIRSIHASDAAAFLDLCRQLDRETTFMMLEPDERTTTLEEQRAELERVVAAENQTLIVAEIGERLVGYVGAYGSLYRRERATAYIVAGVLQAQTGRGIGRRLFEELERWARAHAVHRLELTVQTRNVAAVRLYTKLGFQIEGTRRQPLRVDEDYIDEHYMAKLLG